MTIKAATTDDLAKIDLAVASLRQARKLLREVGAEKTVARDRLALTSADGARRHLHHRVRETQRGLT